MRTYYRNTHNKSGVFLATGKNGLIVVSIDLACIDFFFFEFVRFMVLPDYF